MRIQRLVGALPMLLLGCASDGTLTDPGDNTESAEHEGHTTTDATEGTSAAPSADQTSEPASATEVMSGSPDVSHHATDAGSTDEAEQSMFESIPNPALLVANGGSGEVTLINPTTLAVVGSLPVMAGMHPHHLGIAPDGSKVLITATSADLSMGHAAAGEHASHGGEDASTMVYQLDLSSQHLTSVLEIAATAHNAAFTTDGSTIVLSMMEHGMVVGFDAASFEEAFSAEGFEMPLEVTPTHTGALLVAESGAGTVAVFDLQAQSVSARFDVGDVPVAAWASGAGNYFVAAEEGMQLRHLLESDTQITMDDHVIGLDGMPGQASETPDGAELWVAVEDMGKVSILDATTHATLGEVVAGTKPHGIVFSPDGERAFVTDEEAGNVIVIDVAERTVVEQIALGGKPNGVVWLED